MIERAARQPTGVGEIGNRGAHIALRRKQPGGIGQYAEVDAVVIFRACSCHRKLPASIQLWLVIPRACLADSAALFQVSTLRPGAGSARTCGRSTLSPLSQKII